MHASLKYILGCLIALGLNAPTFAQDARASLPARVELIPFESLTLPDSAFLKGDKSAAKPALLAASPLRCGLRP